MSTYEISTIRDLIKVLNDGVDFYTDAKNELRGSGYEPALQDMIDARQDALARLQPFVYSSEGEVETGHTFVGSMRKTYADVLTSINPVPPVNHKPILCNWKSLKTEPLNL